MKTGAMVLNFWLHKPLVLRWLKSSFYTPDSKINIFFRIWWFAWSQLMTLNKMKSCMWKSELGLWTYSLTNLLRPSGPYLVSRPQTLRPRYFLKFNHVIGFNLWFLIKWVMFVKIGARILDFWLDKIFGPKWNL